MFGIKVLPKTGYKPCTSGVGSNRSTNWPTTTAPVFLSFLSTTFFLASSYLLLSPSLSVLLITQRLERESHERSVSHWNKNIQTFYPTKPAWPDWADCCSLGEVLTPVAKIFIGQVAHISAQSLKSCPNLSFFYWKHSFYRRWATFYSCLLVTLIIWILNFASRLNYNVNNFLS